MADEALRARYEAAGQGHVFKFLDAGKVSAEEKTAFLKQLDGIDLDYTANSYRAAMAEAEAASSGASVSLSPPDSFTCLADCLADEVLAWEQAGLAAVGRGEVAACVLAGGQGTRLGFDGPKGLYNIGLPSKKTLFQLSCEKICRLVELAKSTSGKTARMPFLVMTSPFNHDVTMSYFKDNNYFGLPADDVWFFAQGTLPCLTKEGKIMLESAGQVATAPDGNGGFYPALKGSGCLDRLEQIGVKYLHVFSVDNALCRPADIRFVGFAIAKDADCANKCVWKVSPEEKVGVVAKKDGKSSVVEYSELDDANKNARDASGRLVFGAGNICNHMFTVRFLADVVIPGMASLFHLAHKKIPCADEEGVTMQPTANNGIKLEAFIFDTFGMSSKMAILETAREEEFAPVKNAPGSATDSPDTACAMVNALARQWLKRAGAKLEGPDDAMVEISPLLTYAGEGLESYAGSTIAAPKYLS
mmetsp:Transcript_47241/g.106093  ORF Transcript_47241/g.106093 Transcript_47241/m.106093 type:complete len:474 (-) Transcript_47241:9-1430(-)